MLDGITYITGDEKQKYICKDYFVYRGDHSRVNLDALEADHTDPSAWVHAIAHALASCNFLAGIARVRGILPYQCLLVIGESNWSAVLLLDGARKSIGLIRETDRSRLPAPEEFANVAWLDKQALFAETDTSVRRALEPQGTSNRGGGRLD